MNRFLKRPFVLAGSLAALLAVVSASVLIIRAPAHPVPKADTGSANLTIIPQPGSPLQIVSVIPVTPQPPPSMPYVPDLKAWQVVLKNITTHNILAYALRMPLTDAPKAGPYPRGAVASHSRFAVDVGSAPLLAPGATVTDRVHFACDFTRGPVSILVDFVFLDDGTIYGPNETRAEQTLIDGVSDRRGADSFFLHMLQTQGFDATEDFLKKELAYYDDLAPKVSKPKFIR